MPFSPSDFAWWVWLVFAIGAAVVCVVCLLIASEVEENYGTVTMYFFGLLAFLAGVAGAGCLLITLIRFVKWVWGS
jgi:hypothetical protein